MPTGKVKWFNDTKGYGFISYTGGDDAFVHYNDILTDGRRTLLTGDIVQFALRQTPNGPKAEDVCPIVDESADTKHCDFVVAAKGYIKHYNPKRHFGFISSTQGEFYFHQSAVVDITIRKGQPVEFDADPLQPASRWPKATRVSARQE